MTTENVGAPNVPQTRAPKQKHQIDFRYGPKLQWTCIGFPDDQFKSLIREDGSLQYGWNRVITFGWRHAAKPPRCSQSTESAESAVVLTELEYDFGKLTLTTFAHREAERRSDIVLWELKANAEMDAPLIAAVTVMVDEADLDGLKEKFAVPSREIALPIVLAEKSQEQPSLIRSVPSPLSLCEDYEHIGRHAFTTETEALEPGATLRGAFVIALNHDELEKVSVESCEQALAETRDFWKSCVFQKRKLQMPDDSVQEMITACARNLLQARVIKEGLPIFQVGPLVYRGLWVVDGHFMTEAARYLGHDDEADLHWDALLQYRREDGAITIHPYHTKETGIALATLVRLTELSGNWERLRNNWHIIEGAVRRIAEMRQEAAALPESHPCHGLLPESYGDGGVGGQRPEYTTVLWILAGLRQASLAAKRLGAANAQELCKMYEDLLADFQEHAARHMLKTDDGIPYLPIAMFPDEHNFGTSPFQDKQLARPWTKIAPAGATWALCHAIYPGEVFRPDDPIVQNLLALNASIDDDEGLPRETGWTHWKGTWSYHASFAAHVALYAGDPAQAVDYLYALANRAATTRVWREEHSLQSHPQVRYVGDMPHNWASAEFIRLVRNLLVMEIGDELHLLRGLPEEWIVAGKQVIVEETPTRFGPVSITVSADEDGEIDVSVKQDMTWPLRPIRTEMRMPAGAMDVRVECDGRLSHAAVPSDGRIILPEAADINVRFKFSK